jgi:hypothetical protein
MNSKWLDIAIPLIAALLGSYVMVQGHDIKINRLESDMRNHIDEHKKESKDINDKLSRIDVAIERIETKLDSLRGK